MYSTGANHRPQRRLVRSTRTLAGIGADRVLTRHLVGDIELAALDLHHVHGLHGLVIAGADGLFALRGRPGEAAQGRAHLVGVGALAFSTAAL